ncbi:MAG: UpxY family transcription antiterminator [Calditrichaeota bacterium]|nr:UpxY family transcription antiterminator [Calditrichota bacterium]
MPQFLSHSIFGELNQIPHWYAISTKARHEKKVFERLTNKKINVYLPLQKKYRKWSDRYKLVDEPLFSCYIFVRIALKNRLDVLQTDGVVRIVSFNGIPATIPDSQFEAIKRALEEHPGDVEKIDYLTPGQRVEVIQGSLKGIQGTLVQVKNKHRLVLRIDSIMQAISVDIDFRDVKILNDEMMEHAN